MALTKLHAILAKTRTVRYGTVRYVRFDCVSPMEFAVLAPTAAAKIGVAPARAAPPRKAEATARTGRRRPPSGARRAVRGPSSRF